MGVAQGAIIAVAVILVLGLAKAVAQKPPKVDEATGAVILQYGWPLRVLGLICGPGMCLAVIVLMLVVGFKEPGDPYYAGGIFLLFGVLGGVLMLEAFRVRIILDGTGITGHSPWGKVRSIGWSNVQEVSYSLLAGWFLIRATDGQTIRVPMLLTGIRSLVSAVQLHLRPEQYAGAEKGFEMAEKKVF